LGTSVFAVAPFFNWQKRQSAIVFEFNSYRVGSADN
jgi:hypothetical protein